jgi:hypothetical protein
VELGTSTPFRRDKPSRLENAEVLRDRLTAEAQAVPHSEHGTNLEQGLTVARRQFVKDRPPCLIVKSPEHINHASILGKSQLAYQGPPRFSSPYRSTFPIERCTCLHCCTGHRQCCSAVVDLLADTELPPIGDVQKTPECRERGEELLLAGVQLPSISS